MHVQMHYTYVYDNLHKLVISKTVIQESYICQALLAPDQNKPIISPGIKVVD